MSVFNVNDAGYGGRVKAKLQGQMRLTLRQVRNLRVGHSEGPGRYKAEGHPRRAKKSA